MTDIKFKLSKYTMTQEEVVLRSPIKILRQQLKHMESFEEHLRVKISDLESQLDYVQWDLNELLGFKQEIELSIKHLEGLHQK